MNEVHVFNGSDRRGRYVCGTHMPADTSDSGRNQHESGNQRGYCEGIKACGT